jgi:hypothetical protein
MKHGKGTMFFADGTMHSGRWAENERNGTAMATNVDGKETYGFWLNEKLVSEFSKKEFTKFRNEGMSKHKRHHTTNGSISKG